MTPAPKRARVSDIVTPGMFFVPEGPATSHVEESVKTKIRLGNLLN